MIRTPRAASLFICGLLAMAAGGVSGCGSAWSDFSCGMERAERTDERVIDHVSNMPVYVRTRNGSITIRTGEGQKASISAKLSAKDEQSLGLITLTTERDAGGTLRVIADWPKGSSGQQGCSITVTLPDARGLDLDTSNGSVTFSGASGDAKATTSNGSVNIASHNGNLRIETTNGSIDAQHVAGKLIADTSNGRILAKEVGGPVTARSSNGSIDIGLATQNAGPVSIETSNSSATLRVGPAFAGELSASCSNGTVKWIGPSSVTQSGSSKNAHFAFPQKGEKSRIETSNGSITIEQK